jgi:hypothetical protein
MKVTIEKVLDAKESMGKLLQKDLPIKSSFKLSRLVKKLNEELEVFNEKRKDLFKKFGKELEDGRYHLGEEVAEDYNNNLKELLSVEIEIDFEPLKVDQLGENITISTTDLMQLDGFIDIDG